MELSEKSKGNKEREFSSENNPFFNAEILNQIQKQAERSIQDFCVKLCENGCSYYGKLLIKKILTH